MVITGNTFVENHATSFFRGEMGGAIAVLPFSDRIVIANNVMAFNTSGVYRRSGATLFPTLLHNDMWNGAYDYVNLSPGPGDITADPRFIDRPLGNYRLQATSPAIDAGSNDHAPLPWDLDGAPRIQDGEGNGTAIVDMGAFEYSPDSDHDGTVDWLDPDDDNDGAPDIEDCAPFDPSVWNAPVEPADVRLSGGATVHVEWTDQDPGTLFDIAGGSVTVLLADRGFGAAVCRVDDWPAPPWTDDGPGPEPGDAHYYLVRAENACGPGTWGRASDGVDRSIVACP
jgi:hypothetical protein